MPPASRRPGGRTAAAAKEDEEGFALDRANPELHLLKGKRLLIEGQTDAAVREMREAVKADPSRAQAYVDLARALMQKPEGATAAQEALITAIRTMGESPRLMVMLGQVYFREGRLDDAARAVSRRPWATRSPRTPMPAWSWASSTARRRTTRRASSSSRAPARSSSGRARASRRRSPSWAAPTRRRGIAPGPTRASVARWTPTPRAPTPTSSTPASSARTAGRGRRPGSPRRKYLELEPRGDHAADAQALAR